MGSAWLRAGTSAYTTLRWTAFILHVRLDLMRLNTMPALEVGRLQDTSSLARISAAELRELGRLPYPMIRRRGEPGFTRLTWDEAINITAARFAKTDPHRIAFYLTSRGLTNEVYYAAQKAARFLGTNNVDNSSRICHAPSTVALKHRSGIPLDVFLQRLDRNRSDRASSGATPQSTSR
jgi:formylmethanofuran dehydrogenase subunit B